MSKGSQQKVAHQLRNNAIDQGRTLYTFDFTLGDIITLEKQIRDCVSLPLGKISLTYTTHLTQLNGMGVVVIYDKKRNCIESIMPSDLLKTWIDLKPRNRYLYKEWRKTWEK